jgi:prespore-specific regulator
MKTMRQDAWTAEDDVRLAEIVLAHIRDGSTQLAAFEEAAEQLGRTPAASGYRWNACVRKQYMDAIDLAKLERKERREEGIDHSPSTPASESAMAEVNWNTVLRFIRQYRHEFHSLQGRVKQLERDSDLARMEVERLRRDKSDLLGQLRTVADEHVMISEDYRALLTIVDRARRRQRSDAEPDPDSDAGA